MELMSVAWWGKGPKFMMAANPKGSMLFCGIYIGPQIVKCDGDLIK